MPKTICIDIDGTLVHYEEWQGEKHFGEIIDGSTKAMHELHERGWFIIIYTTRSCKDVLSKFLNDKKIEFDAINENPYQPENAEGGKPYADVYVDDRAVCFRGDWNKTLKEIENFKPWEMVDYNKKEDVAKQLLITDFQQALYLHRHYDEMNMKLTNFAFGQVLVSVGACWTLLYAKWINKNIFLQKYTLWGVFLILLLSAAFLLMSMLLIGKNRTYFVKICRYINELRDYAIINNGVEFMNKSKMWHNPTFPNVKDRGSTQMICFYLIFICYLIESIAAGVSFFYACNCPCKLIASIIIIVILILVALRLTYKSLKEIK